MFVYQLMTLQGQDRRKSVCRKHFFTALPVKNWQQTSPFISPNRLFCFGFTRIYLLGTDQRVVFVTESLSHPLSDWSVLPTSRGDESSWSHPTYLHKGPVQERDTDLLGYQAVIQFCKRKTSRPETACFQHRGRSPHLAFLSHTGWGLWVPLICNHL